MLDEILVENLLILDEATVALHPGFNVISGETGVGKSLLLSAIELLFGNRLEGDPGPGVTTRVEGRFALTPEMIRELRSADASSADDEHEESLDELVIRVVKRGGGSQRSYLNGNMISRAELGKLAGRLVDVHGQRDLQRLLSEREQSAVLDSYAKTTEQAATCARLHAELASRRDTLKRRAELEAELNAQLDLFRFQLRELDEAELSPGERATLDTRFRVLDRARDVARELGRATASLEGEDGVLEVLGSSIQSLEALAEGDDALRELTDRLAALEDETADLTRDMASLADRRASLDEDPSVIGNRLDRLNELCAKYRGDEEALIIKRDQLREQVQGLEDREAGFDRLQDEIDALEADHLKTATKLTRARARAAKKLSVEIEKELHELQMPKARFAIDAGESAMKAKETPGPNGFGRPRFQLCSNPGRPFADLTEAASGGELSRVLLALKSVLADLHGMPLLIFDEIETGVGPRLGLVLGRRLKRLAAHRQVLCITHFPQIAAFADRHFRVSKDVDKNGRGPGSRKYLEMNAWKS